MKTERILSAHQRSIAASIIDTQDHGQPTRATPRARSASLQ
jgi:hypothetical protein